MKINGNYILREVAGEHILIPTGHTALNFNGIVMLNPVAALVWQCLEKDMPREEIVNAIFDEYETDLETAAKDMDELLAQMKEKGFVEE